MRDGTEEKATEASDPALPLLRHSPDEETAFAPSELVAAVRRTRGMEKQDVPDVCVLDFDGDLTDKLVRREQAREYTDWPCFHTRMWLWPADEPLCGIVPRTIGGPYAVLVAEQMAVCGAKAVVGLASAGRIDRGLPLPAVVVADEAIRDEGTSYHYAPPGQTIAGDPELAGELEAAVAELDLPSRLGMVWTTDAPYRETASQVSRHAERGVLAVEMQAASLFAFGQHHDFPAGLVAHVTNAVGEEVADFDKGHPDTDIEILRAMVRAARAACGSA